MPWVHLPCLMGALAREKCSYKMVLAGNVHMDVPGKEGSSLSSEVRIKELHDRGCVNPTVRI